MFPTTSNTYDLLVMCRPGGEGDAVQVVVSSHRGILIECASNSSSPRCPLGTFWRTVRCELANPRTCRENIKNSEGPDRAIAHSQ